jgi:membrane glycosyltransferase
MEANPGAGIIQTAPRAVGRETMYARMQQFATRVYGPLFTAGLHFWQLGESHYWGHNAILRVAPFMRHCALRRLPGRGSLSGDILSHDFVEAALMRRAGWAVWIAYDLRGSYEEMPPNLVDELSRDRRWCQGNLMNFRLFLLKGLHVAHRAVFMSGVMAYLSALLWFVFLILSTALLAVHTLSAPKYFLQPYQLFPLWPEWHPEWAIALFGATALLLFLPKILSVLAVSATGASRFGGTMRLAMSVVGELVLSALLAPIRMLFHTRFVLLAFLGWNLQWQSPRRGDTETTWREALSRHGPHTLLGVLWAGGVYWLNPSFLWWLLPVAGALIVSIPVSVYTSRVALGRRLRAAGMFVIPEELSPPEEIRAIITATRTAPRPRDFTDAVVDPVTNALICATRTSRARQTETSRRERSQLLRAALIGGPDALTEAQKMRIIGDSDTLSELHTAVWTSAEAHPRWRGAIGSVAAAAPHDGAEMRVALNTA